jgi:hypothetical protein
LADFGRGIKAGVITGIIYLVIYLLVGVISFYESLYLIDLLDAAGLAPVVSPVYPGFVSSFGIFGNILRGIIFGVIFAVVYNLLPGTKSVIKGVVLSLFLWIVTVIEVIYTMPEWSGVRGTYYGGTVVLSSVSLIFVGIMFALLFGALTGLLWDRFRGKELTEERKGRSVLLVGFILGGIIWVLFALMFLIGRVPLAVTGSEFWWERMVTRLVLFLGLPGWIVALVAWRKTRRGESGFKWGMAGGVTMALTGIMLLPGALTIAGGALSGRKPTSEPSTATTER